MGRFLLLFIFFPVFVIASDSLFLERSFLKPQDEIFTNPSLEKLAQNPGSAWDFFRLKLAEKQLKDSRFLEAIKTMSRVKDGLYDLWKQVIGSEAYLGLGKPEQALTILRNLPPFPEPKISYGEDTYRLLFSRFLWTRFRAKSSLHKNFTEEISLIIAVDPLNKPLQDYANTLNLGPFDSKSKILKLHHLYFAYQFEKIPGLLDSDEILKADIPEEKKCRALFELGDGQRHKKEFHRDGVQTLQKLTTLNCPEILITKALFRLGTLGSYTKDENLLKNSWTELYTNFPSNRLADDALYQLYHYYKKNHDEGTAKKYHQKLLSWKQGDMRSDLIYEEAYPFIQKKEFAKAIKILKQTYNAEPAPGESYTRNIYWHARALEKSDAKKKTQAEILYKKLAVEFPFSYYAVLAANRIDKRVSLPNLPLLHGEAPLGSLETFDTVITLNSKGFHEAARAALDLILHQHPEWLDTHKEFVTKHLLASQNYRKAIDVASEHFESGVYGPTTHTNDPLFAAFYPEVYRKQVRQSYQKTTLPKGTIEGIMREESLFQSNVKSRVGATGLMQLMPSTAKMLSRKLHNTTLCEDLTHPENNILLGSSYFKEMQTYFDDQLPLAIMAYNAGPGNVRKWLKQLKSQKELDEFIEEIPFDETKNYVKRVLRSMQVYGHRYHEPYFRKNFLDLKVEPYPKKKR